jgi:hypothetical protein
MRQGSQGKTSKAKTRQDKKKQGKTRLGKTRQKLDAQISSYGAGDTNNKYEH